MKAYQLKNWPWEWPTRKHQRQRLVHSRATHPSTLCLLLPQIEADATPECECGKTAALLVLKHKIDNCLDDDLSDDGAEILFKCVRCVRGIADTVAADLERRLEHVPPGEGLYCLTCRREISSFHSALEFERL